MEHRRTGMRPLTLAVASLFLTAILFGGTTVFAQVSEGLQMKPAIIEGKINPGDSATYSIKVTNLSSEERTLYLSPQNIEGVNEKGLPRFVQEGVPTGYELSSWVVISDDVVVLKPNKTKVISFEVRVPKDAAPGAHVGGIFLDARAPRLRTSGSGISVKVGTLISLRISGDIIEEARMREFSTEHTVYSSPKITFNSKVENLGNVLLRPQGLIEITDMFGKQVANIPVNDAGASVFPKTQKIYATEWNYQRFTFGRYQAVVSLVFGDEARKTISSTSSFWVLPAQPILIACGTLLGFLLLLYFFVRMYLRRKFREMELSGRSSEYHLRRSSQTASRLVGVALSVFFVCVLILVLLFLLFA
ncbi:DUF916 domain-containing protein [bacterium]|nr:DUF916 domain-containing protein [bacterium]